MASGKKQPASKNQLAREARERARVYRARTAFHAGQSTRRTRDNWISGAAAAVIIAAAIMSQVAAYSSGPFAPEPEPAPTSTDIPTPSPTATLEPLPAPTP